MGPLYGRPAAAKLGIETPLELPDGERYKTWPRVEAVCRWLLERGLHRRDTLVAVGGGVVTDLVGFAAAVYLRGIDWVAVPTTLLAMVDAAVGGKTGVNLAEGKNLVGVFWAPRLVVADVETLHTLPRRELKAGLAEVIKSAWIGDRRLLDLLPADEDRLENLRDDAWEELVARTVAVKARVVMEDERESGARQALNLGHTLAHALETATGYRRFRHGEAVAWGMLAAGRIAESEGLLGPASHRRLDKALRVVTPLPRIDDLSVERLLTIIGRDKKLDEEGVAWVLPTENGVTLGRRVAQETIRDTLAALTAESSSGEESGLE